METYNDGNMRIELKGQKLEELLPKKMELGKFLDYAFTAYLDTLKELGIDSTTFDYRGASAVDLANIFIGNVCQRINVDNISEALKEK